MKSGFCFEDDYSLDRQRTKDKLGSYSLKIETSNDSFFFGRSRLGIPEVEFYLENWGLRSDDLQK